MGITYYHYAVLSGIILSAGGLSESLVRDTLTLKLCAVQTLFEYFLRLNL